MGIPGTLHIRNAPPLSQGFLTIGSQESDLPNYLGLGINALNAPWTGIIPITTPAASGTNITASLDFNATADPMLAGQSFYFQAFFLYPALAGQYLESRGLEITIGR